MKSPTFSSKYGKKVRLKSPQVIREVFLSKMGITVFPVRLHYKIYDISDASLAYTTTKKSQIGVTVSKRKFKRAVDRNRIKRLLRQSYITYGFLLEQEVFSTIASQQKRICIMLSYITSKPTSQQEIDKSVEKAFKALQEKFMQTDDSASQNSLDKKH